MGIKTAIQYCDSTINPVMGCDGCELYSKRRNNNHCYAAALTKRYAGRKGWPKSFDEPELFTHRIDQACGWKDLTGTKRSDKPWLNGVPRIIFLNDLSDSFTESLPIDWLYFFLDQMADSPHIWLLLTKRPWRMEEFCLGLYVPKNFWLGTTITEDSETAACRLRTLTRIKRDSPDLITWLSVEPMLEAAVLPPYHLAHIDWVACGCESGPGARPMQEDWVRGLRDQCQLTGTPFFYKQAIVNGKRVSMPELDGRVWDQMPQAAVAPSEEE